MSERKSRWFFEGQVGHVGGWSVSEWVRRGSWKVLENVRESCIFQAFQIENKHQ